MSDLIETVFGEGDPEENQLELYQEQLDEYQEKLDKLEGEDTPEAAEQRQQVGIAIYDTQVKMQQVKESQQQKLDKTEALEPRGFDLFRD